SVAHAPLLEAASLIFASWTSCDLFETAGPSVRSRRRFRAHHDSQLAAAGRVARMETRRNATLAIVGKITNATRRGRSCNPRSRHTASTHDAVTQSESRTMPLERFGSSRTDI